MNNILIKLDNVRLSFVSVFHKAKFNGEESKYEVTFLLSKKDNSNKNKIESAINKLLSTNNVKLPTDKICKIVDGDNATNSAGELLKEAYVGYEGHWAFKASNDKRILIIDKDKSPIEESDDKIYSGCYCNGLVEIWYQNHKTFGKRINAKLVGLQFVKHGDSFTGAITAEQALNKFDEVNDNDVSIEDIADTLV